MSCPGRRRRNSHAGRRGSLRALCCRLGLGLGLGLGTAPAGCLLSAASEGDSLAALKDHLGMQFSAQVRPLLETYCAACHGDRKHKGDINFSALAADPTAARGVWRTCSEKLRIREMPPEKEKQPSDDERAAILAWITALKRLSPQDPGRFVIRRLTKVEYANTLHDLLGVDPAVASELPLELPGEGYTNTISPLLMEKYLLIADEVLDTAIRPPQLDLAWTAGQLDAVIDGKRDARRADGAERRFARRWRTRAAASPSPAKAPAPCTSGPSSSARQGRGQGSGAADPAGQRPGGRRAQAQRGEPRAGRPQPELQADPGPGALQPGHRRAAPARPWRSPARLRARPARAPAPALRPAKTMRAAW